MLWTFLVPGVNVVFRSPYTEDDMCGKGRKAVKLEVYKYDCKSFDSENVWSEVVLYGGEKPFGQPVHLSLRLDCGVARQKQENFGLLPEEYWPVVNALRKRPHAWVD
ncbi:hypothetical protein AXG93_138s1290 [Marchantia polymorpha subsp. ruderalis]|uniref:Uncharacterized protein n=1 Tax=Marchantia polymorpha subsp. ruderalis TaxID=1480154 RepID=A0A176VLM0_MARPO|nr:hypothetical protein AXG93_138s1290 [Marchantia polymorpha subsp. ruderalis]